jgi:hypothetical protein
MCNIENICIQYTHLDTQERKKPARKSRDVSPVPNHVTFHVTKSRKLSNVLSRDWWRNKVAWLIPSTKPRDLSRKKVTRPIQCTKPRDSSRDLFS